MVHATTGLNHANTLTYLLTYQLFGKKMTEIKSTATKHYKPDLNTSCLPRHWQDSAENRNYIYVAIPTTVLRPLYKSTCVSRHLQLRTGGFCCCKVLLPTMTATSAFRLREKTLELSATVLSTLTLYLSNNTRMLSCNCIAIVDLQLTLRLSLIHIWRCRRLLTCRSRWSPYH